MKTQTLSLQQKMPICWPPFHSSTGKYLVLEVLAKNGSTMCVQFKL